jgi:hypothetical protein
VFSWRASSRDFTSCENEINVLRNTNNETKGKVPGTAVVCQKIKP